QQRAEAKPRKPATSIHLQHLLIPPAGIPDVAVVIDAAAAILDRLAQHGLDGAVQRPPLPAGEAMATASRAHPGKEACLVDVDVAQPGYATLVEQHGFEHARAASEEAVELRSGEFGRQWLQ